jgi:signal transduction histidine kinase/tetratricopeptide (TPR) repeat protein
LFYIFFLSIPFTSIGQDLQYYLGLADKAKSPTSKLAALDSVLRKSFRKDDSIFIAKSLEFIEIAKEIDSIDQAAKKAMNLQSILTYSRNDPKLAIRVIDGVIVHKYKISNSFLKGGLYLKRGRANEQLNPAEALEDFSLAIKNFSVKDSVYVADAYLFSGRLYSNMGKFVPAGENYEKAYTYFENLKDYEYMLYAKQGIVTMFSMNGFYEKAKEERNDLIDQIIKYDKKAELVLEHYNQAYDYKRQGFKEKQLEELLKAEVYLPFAKDNRAYQMMVYSALSEYYSENGNLSEAQKHIDTIDVLINDVKGNTFAESNYYTAKSTYFLEKGRYKQALSYAQMKFENASAIDFDEEIMYSHLLLSKIYRKMGDYRLSMQNQEQYSSIKDSLYNTNTANSLAYYQTLYETEKKEKELAEINSNIVLLEKDSTSFKKLAYTVTLTTLLSFGLILLYRSQRTLKNNKRLQEKFSQELLISQEEERKRISKDLHDGLGQSLLLIKNKITKEGDPATKKMVDHAIEEVRTISRDLHPFQLQEMGITRAIENTLSQIDENTMVFISSDIENIDNLFTPEQEVNIYRIVQESLNNIIKHAHAGASRVSVKKLANEVIILVKDNGKGFDFSQRFQDVKSLGLKTLLERTKVLNGQMKVQSKIDMGTSIEFQIPLR